jgi:hypothetical protein
MMAARPSSRCLRMLRGRSEASSAEDAKADDAGHDDHGDNYGRDRDLDLTLASASPILVEAAPALFLKKLFPVLHASMVTPEAA